MLYQYIVNHQKQAALHTSYHITHQEHHVDYSGALMHSSANRGMDMVGSDTHVLATILHAHVDIMGIGGTIIEHLPLVQCASVVETVNEGKVVLIMSQYTHKPDSKTIHSKSQVKHFGGMVYDSALQASGHQMVITHEGYTIPLHVCNRFFYMDMTPASDNDSDSYPHVFLTTDSFPLESGCHG